ncbi:MAG: hypothetical protein ABL908_01815 [Hyphomicrobium sp.]
MPIPETELCEKFIATFNALLVADTVQFGHQHDVLPDREVSVDIGLFRHNADALPGGDRMCCHVVSCNRCRTLGRRDETSKHADGRTLACTIRPKKPENLSARDGERDAIDSQPLTVSARETARCNGWHIGLFSLWHFNWDRMCCNETR